MEICERHDEVLDALDDHEERIKYLELNDVEVRTELKNLICTVKDLIAWIKAGIGAVILGGAGLIVWFIQRGF